MTVVGMESVGVQTEDTNNDAVASEATSIGFFTELLSILDDEHRNIYYDVSDACLQEENSKWSVNAESGDESFGCMISMDSCQDLTNPQTDTDKMTTTELEQTVQLSEFRLRNNLAVLKKLQPSENPIQQWLDTTSLNGSISSMACQDSMQPCSPASTEFMTSTEYLQPSSPPIQPNEDSKPHSAQSEAIP